MVIMIMRGYSPLLRGTLEKEYWTAHLFIFGTFVLFLFLFSSSVSIFRIAKPLDGTILVGSIN